MPLGQGFGGFDFGAAQGGMGGGRGFGSPPQRNTPFPARQNAPSGQVVNNPLAGMGSMQDWQTDWQNRYNQTPRTLTRNTTTAPQWSQMVPGATGSSPANQQTMSDNILAGLLSGSDLPEEEAQSLIGWQFPTGVDWTQGSAYDPARGAAGMGASHRVMTDPGETRQYSAPNPAYQALLDERNQFEPLFQNQQRQQQAFNMMEGQGQRFGMMGEDYVNPGFGQVSGEVNPFSPDMGAGRAAVQGANDGISTDWLSGVYDPTQMQAMGVYRPRGGYGFGGM